MKGTILAGPVVAKERKLEFASDMDEDLPLDIRNMKASKSKIRQ